jgi:hypothetical protein
MVADLSPWCGLRAAAAGVGSGLAGRWRALWRADGAHCGALAAMGGRRESQEAASAAAIACIADAGRSRSSQRRSAPAEVPGMAQDEDRAVHARVNEAQPFIKPSRLLGGALLVEQQAPD